MKKILFACAISMLSLTQAIAETITIDGVVDDTPGQAFSNAKGYGIQLLLLSAAKKVSWLRFVGDSMMAAPDRQDKFSQQLKYVFSTDENAQNMNAQIKPNETELQIAVYVGGENLHGPNGDMLAEETIKRDLNKPVDRKFRIHVTDFEPMTPTGKAFVKVKIEELAAN